jgi:hypothetical protein
MPTYRYRYVALAAACAVAVAGPAGVASAAGAHHAAAKPVLSIRRADGPAVKKTNKLVATLAKGTSLVLSLGTSSQAQCTSASLTARVTANPASSGLAALSITRSTAADCTVTEAPISGITLTKLTTSNLSFPATVSTAAGDPVTISEQSTAKPITVTADLVVPDGIGDLTCVYTAPSYSGHLSNTHNRLKFTDQTFTLDTSSTVSSADCSIAGATSTMTATYGPLRDDSVKFSPKVFVN